MRPEIKKQAIATEFETPERCHIIEIANDIEDGAVSIARARVIPSMTTEWHKLNGVTERYIIISGRGRVEIDGIDPVDIGEGDVVRIPSGAGQRVTNTGIDDLVFYCVCSPRFQPSCYISLE